MAQYQTGDGRWLVGDVTGESSYHGFLGWRDCVIQLTGEGATEQSVHYLEALRDYALAHNPLGEPIMPPSINVWISNNGTTTAVQADDLSIDGGKFTIGGIVWDGSTWDYSDAGKTAGGGSGGDPGYTVTEEHIVVLPEQTVTTAQAPNGTATYIAEVTGYNPGEYSELTITYNGQSYTCSNKSDGLIGQYGADFNATTKSFDFTSFPFALSLRSDGNGIVITETATEVSIKAESVTKVVTPSEDFKEAVKESGSGGGMFVVTADPTAETIMLDKTAAEILDALSKQCVVSLVASREADTFIHAYLAKHTASKGGKKTQDYYSFTFMGLGEQLKFDTNALSEHPTLSA